MIYLYRFLNGKPSVQTVTTIGLPNYFSNYILSDGSITNVQIMDTCGQERFKSINSSYYKNADCILLVYDITSNKSFNEVKNYFNKNIKENCKKNIPVILLGNKSDLEEKREVLPEDGAKFAEQNDYIFMETSCLTNENVADAFETLIEITNREAMKDKECNKTLKLNNKKRKSKSEQKCC